MEKIRKPCLCQTQLIHDNLIFPRPGVNLSWLWMETQRNCEERSKYWCSKCFFSIILGTLGKGGWVGSQGSSSTSKKVLGRISTPLASQKLSIGPIESSRRDLAFSFFRFFSCCCLFLLFCFLFCFFDLFFRPGGWKWVAGGSLSSTHDDASTDVPKERPSLRSQEEFHACNFKVGLAA